MRIGIDCRKILHPLSSEHGAIGHYTYYLVKKHENYEEDIIEKEKYWQRQALPGTFYWKNGAVYVASSQTIKDSHSVYGKEVYPLIIPMERLVNIDNELDFQEAEYKLEKKLVKLDFRL